MEKNILALDLGKRSLGLAISRSGIIVSSLPNLKFDNCDFDKCMILFKDAIKNETIEHIVVGLPLYPSGDECEMTPIVKSFIEKRLKPLFPNIEIKLMDERLSTVEASEILHLNNKNAKKQKSVIDSYAASVILERYLKSINQL